ncbi:sugar ABC transporter permease, partial [Bacillus subtilis]|nr:sugar ABC transporter permease [Bacillus subtilis]
TTILRTPESYTLPVCLFNLVNDVMGSSYTTFAAGALLISIPVAVIFIMLQKNFVS